MFFYISNSVSLTRMVSRLLLPNSGKPESNLTAKMQRYYSVFQMRVEGVVLYHCGALLQPRSHWLHQPSTRVYARF